MNGRVIFTQFTRVLVLLFGVVFIGLVSPTPAAAQTTATYTGLASGTYNDPANWDIGVVPINGMADTFNVVIPPNVTLDFGIPGASNITGLSLGDSSTIRLAAGESFQVDGVSILSGIIDATGIGAAFLSPSQFAAFSGDRPRVFVSNGANVFIAAPSYTFTANLSTTTVMASDGPGSLLNLAAAQSINGTFGFAFGLETHSISATNSGVIDLSGVQTIRGANPPDCLRFLIDAGGNIYFSSLAQTSGRVWFDINVPTYTLPVLQSTASRTRLDVADGTTLTLPALTDFNFGEIVIADGGVINAPILTNFSGSILNLNPNRILNTPLFTNIDESRIAVSGGSVLASAATSYAFNQNISSITILQADGPGSRLNFSSLQNINGMFNFAFGLETHSISATNSGVIDLSGVQTVIGAGGPDVLEFRIGTGGDIDLSTLTNVTGKTKFTSNVPTYALPALVTAGSTWFNLGIGTRFSAPTLAATTGTASAITVPVFAVLDMPVLTSMNETIVDLQDGGTINAPNLTSFTDSYIALSPPRFLVAPLFTNIDNSRIIVFGGSTLGLAASSYTVNKNFQNITLLQADGAGSRLDFASLTSITDGFSDTIGATNNGFLDLSNVRTVNGNVRISVGSGGMIQFGELTTNGAVTLNATNNPSVQAFKSLVLSSPAQLTTSLGGTIRIAGDYTFNHQNEANISLRDGIVHMNGQVIQRMEIGGTDIGIPTGTVTNNFEMGQLIVGQTTQRTTVELIDQIDNGNRGPTGEPESLYLQGFTQGEGSLRILGGSTLVIGNLNVYATDANQTWFRVNDLFPVGVNTIPFDGGFIALTTDCNTNGVPDDQDIANGTSVDCNGNGVPDECEPDCNANGVVDACDVNPADPDGNGLVSTDCDGNGIPDECEPDCNTNGVVDACDVDPLDPDGNGFVSPDCDGNGVPDECDPDCDANGVPDACETSVVDCNLDGVPDSCQLVGNDCNSNLVPDECDTDCNHNGTPDACETITDCNGDGVPDECQLPFNDCNTNLIPDDCDIAGGTSQDCNADGIPDDCQLSGNDCNTDLIPDDCQLVTNDCNANGVPDGCETDCNANGLPDQCDITAGTSQDCDTNGVPDECQLMGSDCNTNGVPDLCDIGAGTSLDCDGNGIPDECDAFTDCNGNGVNDPCDIANAISPDVNGDGIPDDCQVQNLTQGTALATIAAAIATAHDGDELLAAASIFGTETVIDYMNKAVRLSSSASVGQPVGGSLTMAGGGRLSAAAGQGITLGGSLTVPVISDVELFGTPVTVEAGGALLVTSAAGAAINGDLVNSGAVTVQGGTLASSTLQNNAGATLTVFGGLSGAITNDGSAVYVADTQVVGDYVNNATTTVQNGVLTIIGSLTNNGTIIGDVAGGAALGLTVLGNFGLNATAQLLMSGDTQNVKVDGNLDIAINDNTRYDMAVAELRMIGLGSTVQDLEVMSVDIGPNPAGLIRTLAGNYPIGTLRLGPTPTTVRLVDNRDNDNLGQGVCEALYVNSLIIDPGASLVTNNCRIYYNTLTNNGTVDNPTNLVPLLPSGNIPAVSTWGLVVLFLLVLTIGTLVARFRAMGLQ